jgi:hypothetical protein
MTYKYKIKSYRQAGNLRWWAYCPGTLAPCFHGTFPTWKRAMYYVCIWQNRWPWNA